MSICFCFIGERSVALSFLSPGMLLSPKPTDLMYQFYVFIQTHQAASVEVGWNIHSLDLLSWKLVLAMVLVLERE